jgi:hypothetical protein
MSDEVLVKSYRLGGNVEISKLTAVVVDTGTYPDGCLNPGGANAAKPLGIATSSIMPSGISDYSNGQYSLTSGTAWPAGALGSGTGRAVRVLRKGIGQARISGNVARGDRLNIAGTDGRLKTVSESSTTIHVVAIAEEAGADGDVIRVNVDPYSYLG